MRRAILVIAAAGLAMSVHAAEPDKDRTPVTQCDTLPAGASLLSNAEIRLVCEKMLRILDGVTIADLREFSMASAHAFSEGLRQNVEIARELVEIIRLRGLAQNEPRWPGTLDLVWRLWVAEHGLISAGTIREFLVSSGSKAAKALSDDGLIGVMAAIAGVS